jgi:hypothetical protein
MQRIALVLAALTGALALTPLALAASKPMVTLTATNAKLALTGSARTGAITLHIVNKGTVARLFHVDGKTVSVKPGRAGNLVVTLKKGSYTITGTAKGHAGLSAKLKVIA